MAKKEKVPLIRSDDFEAVDQELADALASLDEVNARVCELLNSERPAPAEGAAPETQPESDARSPETESPAQHETA